MMFTDHDYLINYVELTIEHILLIGCVNLASNLLLKGYEMTTITTPQQAITAINRLNLENIGEVLALGTVDTTWEIEFNDAYSLVWNDEDKTFMLSIFKGGNEEQHVLDYSDEYGTWYVYDWGVERSIEGNLVELVLDNLTRELRAAYGAKLDDDYHWSIECGDNGWMGYVNGQYVVGSYGTNRPHKLLNELLGFEVINSNTESYSSTLPIEEMPFTQK